MGHRDRQRTSFLCHMQDLLSHLLLLMIFSWLNSSVFSTMSHHCFSCIELTVLGSSFLRRTVIRKHVVTSPQHNSPSGIIQRPSSASRKEMAKEAASQSIRSSCRPDDKDPLQESLTRGLPKQLVQQVQSTPFGGQPYQKVPPPQGTSG